MDTKRFNNYVDRSGEPHPALGTPCWLWTGALNKPGGYGKTFVAGRQRLAHVVAYETIEGAVPAGLELDHLCGVKHCVNPQHLEPVTHKINMARGSRALAKVCHRGHSLSDALIRNGFRRCRTCQNEASKAHKARVRAEARGR